MGKPSNNGRSIPRHRSPRGSHEILTPSDGICWTTPRLHVWTSAAWARSCAWRRTSHHRQAECCGDLHPRPTDGQIYELRSRLRAHAWLARGEQAMRAIRRDLCACASNEAPQSIGLSARVMQMQHSKHSHSQHTWDNTCWPQRTQRKTEVARATHTAPRPSETAVQHFPQETVRL